MAALKKPGNDCAKCEMTPALKEAWGCTSPGEFTYDLGGIVIKRCPLSLIRVKEVQQAINLYAFYKKGFMPNGNGLRGETAFYRQVMVELEGVTAEAKEWYTRKISKKKKEEEK